MSKLPIGEYLTVRNLKLFLNGAKTERGRQYLLTALNQRMEIRDFVLLTVVRLSARKYFIQEIMTEDNCNYLDNDEITLTSDWYDIKLFNNVVEVTYYNELFGEQTELRMEGETTHEI